MTKNLITLLCAMLVVSWIIPGKVRSEGLPKSEKLVLHADTLTYEKADDVYRALGDVHLEWDGMKLVADSALLREAESTAEAEGNVVLTKDDDILRADRVTLNFDTEKGEIRNPDFFMRRGNFHLRGNNMQKVGAEDYRIDKGYFTTCDGTVPSWKFSAKDIDIVLGEYATAKNALFYVKDVPVLYFPYIIFPLKRERQSGFLMPKVGTSSKKGFNLDVPYYWAISRSQDATFDLDIQSKRGVGTGLDYRYIRKTGSEGTFRGYLIYDTKAEKFRGELSERHLEQFSPTLVFKSTVNYVSDHDFYRDYAEAFGTYNQKTVESDVFLTKHWRRFVLTPELRFTQDLEAPSNVATMQKLPVITFMGTERLGPSPVYLTLDSNFTNFYREQGLMGQRVDMHPTVSLYANPAGYLQGSAWVGYGHRLYNTYDGGNVNGFRNIGLFDTGASISSTMAKVYDTGWPNLTKLRHMIVPEITYTYVQQRNQESLPFFDFNDRVVFENRIGYSISNYLTGKVVGEGDAPAIYREVAFLKLSQGYDFSGTRRDLLTSYDELHPFSDVRVEARVNPTKNLSFETDSRYNPYHTNFSTANVAVNLKDQLGDLLGLGYRFTRTQFDYLEGRLGIALIKPFIFNFNGRYSINAGAFLESYYSLEYKQQCWSVIFSYGDRQGNQEFFVNFALAGIGPFGRIRTF